MSKSGCRNGGGGVCESKEKQELDALDRVR